LSCDCEILKNNLQDFEDFCTQIIENKYMKNISGNNNCYKIAYTKIPDFFIKNSLRVQKKTTLLRMEIIKTAFS